MRRMMSAVVILLALLLGSQAAPARAADELVLPDLAPLNSVKLNYVSTFQGTPEVVCQQVWESAARIHGTCTQLVTRNDLVAGHTYEYVYYDGMYYQRDDQETTWIYYAYRFDPTLTINDQLFGEYLYPSDTIATDLGDVTVNGQTARQYQFWSTDAELNVDSGGQYVYDLFRASNGYVLKDQQSQRGSFTDGDGEWNSIWTYSDFNTALVVHAPTTNLEAVSVGTPYQLTPGR